MSEQSIKNRIETMAANNALSPDHDQMWKDLVEFEPLKEYLAKLKRKTQLGEIQATHSALCALARNTSNADVAQYVVDLIREVPLEGKKRLLMCVRDLPPFLDATVLLDLADHKVLGYAALGALEATADPRAEATAQCHLLYSQSGGSCSFFFRSDFWNLVVLGRRG